jgi:hypothetical protein
MAAPWTRNTLSRRPAMASPTSSSAAPAPYPRGVDVVHSEINASSQGGDRGGGVAFLDVPGPLADDADLALQRTEPPLLDAGPRALCLALRGMTSPTCAAEQLDRFSVECRDIIGTAARDQALVHDRFLVHPVRAGIPEVGFERGP